MATPISFADGLKPIATSKGEYTFALNKSFCFGPRIFGGAVMSIIHQAAKHYFTSYHNDFNQPDVIAAQWQFFRLLFPTEAMAVIKDVHTGKSGSTLHVTVRQDGKDCMMAFLNMSNLAKSQGFSFETGWTLKPAPVAADISRLADSEDGDPHWVSCQTPYHPESFRRVQAYLKFFVPCDLQNVGYREQWITPSDPRNSFTDETLPFVAELSLPILDNFYPEVSTGSQTATVAAGLQQRRDREEGIERVVDAASGAYKAPAMIISLSFNIEIKKPLPSGGVKWLFMRAFAKQIKDGRLSMEVVILDEHLDLVALSQQLCPIIDLKRQTVNKQRL